MAKLYVLFLVCFTSVIVSGSENRTCDYAFGDSSWDYSKVFYDQDVKFPAGALKHTHTVALPNEKKLMTSSVCVNLPAGINKQTTKVNYDPLDAVLSVVLAKKASKDFNYHVLALRHGY